MEIIYIILTILFIQKSLGIKNNVCPTYLDYYTVNTNTKCWYDVAVDSDVPTIIRGNGYPVEIHKVQTVDSYILTMFRIPNDRFNVNSKKESVLLQHGFLHSGACFVGMGNLSLALTLAAAGYDVWIGNFRGTEYSLEHATLTSDDAKFWDFNCDQFGLMDIPAKLKYISEKTNNSGNIIYIGHSLGTTAALQYGSRFPEEVESIVKVFILMAPNGGMRNTKSIVFRVAPLFMDVAVKLFMNTDIAKTLSPNGIGNILSRFCRSDPILMDNCIKILNFVNMGPQIYTDASIAPIFFNQFPAGSGLKILKQIGDLTINPFSSYDYGLRNINVYGQLRPPIYNVSRINVPIYLIYSKDDWCTTSKDAELLFNRLSVYAKVYGKYEIVQDYFNHNSFVYSKEAKTVIYDKILNLIDSIRT